MTAGNLLHITPGMENMARYLTTLVKEEKRLTGNWEEEEEEEEEQEKGFI